MHLMRLPAGARLFRFPARACCSGSALCFILLAANALLVILDIIVFPNVDFGLWRPILGLASVSVLLFGFHPGSGGGIGVADIFFFLAGAITMGLAMASLFFLRSWRRTHDRLFLAFSAAFLLLALNAVLVAMAHVPLEDRSWLYLLRLAAFAIIIWAVIQKTSQPLGRAAGPGSP